MPVIIDNLADQREPVGMRPRRAQPQNQIAAFDILARQNMVALDRAHGKPRQIVNPFAVEPGQFGGFAAHQRTARRQTALADTRDHLAGDGWMQMPGRKVIQKEQM